MPIPRDQLDPTFLVVDEQATVRQVVARLLSGEPFHPWYTLVVPGPAGEWRAVTLNDLDELAEGEGQALLDRPLADLVADRPTTPSVEIGQTTSLRRAEEVARRSPGGRLLVLDDGEPVGLVAIRLRTALGEPAVVRLYRLEVGPDMAQLRSWGMRTAFVPLRPFVTLDEAFRTLARIQAEEAPYLVVPLRDGRYLLLGETDLRTCPPELGACELERIWAARRCEWRLASVVEAARVRPRQLPPNDVVVVHAGRPIGYFCGAWRGGSLAPKGVEAPRAEARVVNAWFEGHPPSRPLERGRAYQLGLNVGAQRADSYTVGETYRGPAGQDVYVGLVGDPDVWRIAEPRVQKLHVPAQGDSDPVLFGVTPLKPGQQQLTAHFYHRNHLVQTVEITGIQVVIPDQAAATPDLALPPTAVTLTRAAPGAEAVAPRDANLYIEWLPNQDRYRFTFFSAPSDGGEPVLHSARIPLSADEMSVMAAAARDTIETYIINCREGDRRPFLFLSKDPAQQPSQAVFQQAIHQVAQLGYRWFIRLFYSRREQKLAAEDEALGDLLLQASAGGPLRLQIVSSDFYLPWNLLYTPPTGRREPLTDETFAVEGIWGFRHVIEQVPARDLSHMAAGPVIEAGDGLQMSANINLNIDGTRYKPASEQLEYFRAKATQTPPGLRLTTRHTEQEVLQALQDPDNEEEILYFYCHAVTEGSPATRFQESRIILTREAQALKLDTLITATFGLPPLPKAPLVFLNACGSAAMDAQFYDSFVQFMRDRGARTVIGTLNNTPTVAGAVFAMSFFEQFLQGGPERAAAQLLFDLRRQFLEAYRNPVGLSYALFYNGDTYIANP